MRPYRFLNIFIIFPLSIRRTLVMQRQSLTLLFHHCHIRHSSV